MRPSVGRCVAGFVAVSAMLLPIAVQDAGVAQAAPVLRDPRVTNLAALSPSPRVSTTASARIRAVPVVSSFESATRSVSRDIGVSAALPDGHDLWLFGDTVTLVHSGTGWRQSSFIDGGSALETKYTRGRVPRGGEYPSGVPSRFIPVPLHVYLPDGSGRLCTYQTAAFPARWPTGIAVMPGNTSEVLITYTEVCVRHPPGGGAATVRPEGWGYMLYNWRRKHIVRGPVDVFKPHSNGSALTDSRNLGSPQFHNGQLTLFASHCTVGFGTCAQSQSRVWSVTMRGTTAALDKPASYKPYRLSTDTGGWHPLSISVGRYPTGLRLIEMTSLGGTYKIFSAPSVRARWHLIRSGTLPGCPSHSSFCAALQGHPELSTSTQIFVSYKYPDAKPEGHVVVSALPD